MRSSSKKLNRRGKGRQELFFSVLQKASRPMTLAEIRSEVGLKIPYGTVGELFSVAVTYGLAVKAVSGPDAIQLLPEFRNMPLPDLLYIYNRTAREYQSAMQTYRGAEKGGMSRESLRSLAKLHILAHRTAVIYYERRLSELDSR